MAYGDKLKEVVASTAKSSKPTTPGISDAFGKAALSEKAPTAPKYTGYGFSGTAKAPTTSASASSTDWANAIKYGTEIEKANNPYGAVNNYGVTDNSSMISDMYAQQLAAAQAALKAQIQQGVSQYQDTINKAPGQYQPLRDQASATGQQNMQNLREMLANNGQAGGVNRTEETQVNTSTQNQINTLNAQQQSVIDTAQKAIADLQAQGDIESARLVADNAAQKLQALISEKNRVSDSTYSRYQDAFNNNLQVGQLTGTYNGQRTIEGQQLDEQKKQDTFSNKIAEAGLTGYYNGKQTMEGKLNNTQLKLLGAQITGQNLDNESQKIANKYAPDIARGQINYQKAQIEYQKLVNKGYSKSQALDNALKSAQISNAKANTAQTYAQIDLTKAQTAKENKATKLMGLSSSRSSSGRSSSRSSGNVNTGTKSMQSTTAAIDDIVNGKYNLSVKQRTLKAYIKNLDGSPQGKYLKKYAQNALKKVNEQMEYFVNVSRYKNGYGG